MNDMLELLREWLKDPLGLAVGAFWLIVLLVCGSLALYLLLVVSPAPPHPEAVDCASEALGELSWIP